MLMPYWAAAEDLIARGATPWQVDQAMEAFGMVMGPFRVSDLAGNDIGWAIRKSRAALNPQRAVKPNVADALCELGRFGQKTGKGWYRYEAGNRAPIPDPEVIALLDQHRSKLGIAARTFTNEEIVTRCVYALINEGAKLLGEGIAARASDIDMVYLTGYGFPAYRGGPMHYANEVGLFKVLRTLTELGQDGDPSWQPAPLIVECQSAGRSLT